MRVVLQRVFSSTHSASSVARLASSTEARHVAVNGWVRGSQKRGANLFLRVSDGLSPHLIQVVVPRSICSSVPHGSAIQVVGQWQQSSGAQQASELFAQECHVLAIDAEPRYSSLSADALRKSLHLRPRAPSFAALLRLRSKLHAHTHKYFESHEFVHVDTPVLTANDCEGAGETFCVVSGEERDFFGKSDTHLSVSGQLHLEAVASGISRVYTLNGGFRAEKNQSYSHLSEFRMLEVEWAFCSQLDDICQLTEHYLRDCASMMRVQEEELKELGVFQDGAIPEQLHSMLESTDRLPRMRYSEARSLMEKAGEKCPTGGLSRQNELWLVNRVESPLFLTHFPTEQKPFYMRRSEGEPHLTDSFDLLCPYVGELAGGSVRAATAQELKSQGCGVPWYEEGRLRGKPVSAGFGLGFERLLQLLLGVRNIKDTIAFPRWHKHCQC